MVKLHSLACGYPVVPAVEVGGRGRDLFEAIMHVSLKCPLIQGQGNLSGVFRKRGSKILGCELIRERLHSGYGNALRK